MKVHISSVQTGNRSVDDGGEDGFRTANAARHRPQNNLSVYKNTDTSSFNYGTRGFKLDLFS